MSGYSRIRRKILFIVGVGLLSLPCVLSAQTAAERVRAEERALALEKVRAEELARVKVLRERLEERLQFTEQERLERLAEAEFRVQQELTRAKVGEEARAREMEEIEQARAQEVESRMRAVQEARVRAQEDYQRARQEVRRAQQVMVQVKSRVRLGVSLDGTQGEEYDGLGARLAGTLPESPAEEAGLREGDIITHLNGQSLLDRIPQEGEAGFDNDESLPVQRLMALAQDLEAGEDVEVRYLRNGSPETVSFQTAEMDEPNITILRGREGEDGVFRVLRSPGRENLAELENLQIHLKDLELEVENLDNLRENLIIRRFPGPEVNTWTMRGREGSPQLYAFGGNSAGFGLKLADMNPGLSEYFTADEGLLVLEVREDSSLGLVPGDVILAIDGRVIENQGDVRRILGSYEEDEAVSFTVVRKGRETMVEGRVG